MCLVNFSEVWIWDFVKKSTYGKKKMMIKRSVCAVENWFWLFGILGVPV